MNWQVVKDLVHTEENRRNFIIRNSVYTLTTNGVLLNDEVMEFCNKEMGNVV